MKMRIGNKQNSALNGQWGGHVKKWMKKITSGKRRIQDKRTIRDEIKLIQEL